MKAWHTFALEKVIMAKVSGHIQSRMRHPAFAVRLPYFQEYYYLHHQNVYGQQIWQDGDLQ